MLLLLLYLLTIKPTMNVQKVLDYHAKSAFTLSFSSKVSPKNFTGKYHIYSFSQKPVWQVGTSVHIRGTNKNTVTTHQSSQASSHAAEEDLRLAFIPQ